MASTGKFTKPALSVEEQVNKLIAKGMVVRDPDLAVRQLSGIGYYRFSGYTHPFRSTSNRSKFKAGTSFEQVLRI